MKRLLALALMVAATAVAVAPPATASAPGTSIGTDSGYCWYCASCNPRGECSDCVYIC
jgi:hypothetical protein